MRWIKRLGQCTICLLAAFGLYSLGVKFVDVGMVLPEPTSCPGEVYEMELNTVPDMNALGKLSSFVSGLNHVYRMRLDVWDEGENDPVLYVWTEPSKTPDCGFRIKDLEVRRVRGKAPDPRKSTTSGELAYVVEY
jgi:gamma-glutamylcyclotransferase (GGCT)/AIG2-like uncharacterized protein YtfP